MLPNVPQVSASTRAVIMYGLGLAVGRGYIPATLQGPLTDLLMAAIPIISATYFNSRSALIGKTADMLHANGGGTIVLPSTTEAASISSPNVVGDIQASATVAAEGTLVK